MYFIHFIWFSRNNILDYRSEWKWFVPKLRQFILFMAHWSKVLDIAWLFVQSMCLPRQKKSPDEVMGDDRRVCRQKVKKQHVTWLDKLLTLFLRKRTVSAWGVGWVAQGTTMATHSYEIRAWCRMYTALVITALMVNQSKSI